MSEIRLQNIVTLDIVDSQLYKNFNAIQHILNQFGKRFTTVELRLLDWERTLADKMASRDNELRLIKEQSEKSLLPLIERLATLEQEQEQNCQDINDLNFEIQSQDGKFATIQRSVQHTCATNKDLDMRSRALGFMLDEVKRQVARNVDELKKKADKAESYRMKKDLSGLVQSCELDHKRLGDLELDLLHMDQKINENYFTFEKEIYGQGLTNRTDLARKPEAVRQPTVRKGASDEFRQKVSSLEIRTGAIADELGNLSSKVKFGLEHLEDSVRRLDATLSNFKSETIDFRRAEEELMERVGILGVGFQHAQYKMQAFEESLGLLRRGNEKCREELDQVFSTVREMNVKKFSDSIKSMQIEHSMLAKTLSEQLDKKLDSATFYEVQRETRQNSEDVLSSLKMKPERAEIKKALAYFENKLKEVVLIITEAKERGKDFLATRKLIHCLSCDKESEKVSQLPNVTAYKFRSWKPAEEKLDLTMRSSIYKFNRQSEQR